MSKHVTAPQIIELLADRHYKDVFVPECNCGSSWDGCRRMDAWAFRKSWSRFGAIGYEVKVSRSDFEQDQKWTEYLRYCHEFSFVCPGGLIKAHEIPDEVGLIWVSQNKGRLHTKRKARSREIDEKDLVMVMSYVLMSRTKIVADMHAANSKAEKPDKLEEYRQWVEDSEKRKQLASLVSGHVRARYEEMASEVDRARKLTTQAEDLREHLASHGINWDPENQHRWGTWEVRSQINQFVGVLDHQVDQTLQRAASAIEALQKAIEEIRGR